MPSPGNSRGHAPVAMSSDSGMTGGMFLIHSMQAHSLHLLVEETSWHIAVSMS
jgi:hypothetical protein